MGDYQLGWYIKSVGSRDKANKVVKKITMAGRIGNTTHKLKKVKRSMDLIETVSTHGQKEKRITISNLCFNF